MHGRLICNSSLYLSKRGLKTMLHRDKLRQLRSINKFSQRSEKRTESLWSCNDKRTCPANKHSPDFIPRTSWDHVNNKQTAIHPHQRFDQLKPGKLIHREYEICINRINRAISSFPIKSISWFIVNSQFSTSQNYHFNFSFKKYCIFFLQYLNNLLCIYNLYSNNCFAIFK